MKSDLAEFKSFIGRDFSEIKYHLHTQGYEFAWGSTYSINDVRKAIMDRQPVFVQLSGHTGLVVGENPDSLVVHDGRKILEIPDSRLMKSWTGNAIIVQESVNETENNGNPLVLFTPERDNWPAEWELQKLATNRILRTLQLDEPFLPPHPIIVSYIKPTQNEISKGIKAMLLGAEVNIYDPSDPLTEFLHELGHLYWYTRLTKEEKQEWIDYHNTLSKKNASAIFAGKAGMQTVEEAFATIYMWYLKSKVIHEGYGRILRFQEPKGLGLLENVVERVRYENQAVDKYRENEQLLAEWVEAEPRVMRLAGGSRIIKARFGSKPAEKIPFPRVIKHTINEREDGRVFITVNEGLLKGKELVVKDGFIELGYEPLLKAGPGKKDTTKLVRKVITNKKGHRQTVWVRPGEKEKKRKPSSGGGLKEKLLASTINEDYKKEWEENNRLTLLGQKVTNANDLAYLARIYRNPQYETFRIFMLNDKDEVVAQTGISLRLPGAATPFVEPECPPRSWMYYKSMMKNSGATKYYLLHNHPSGRTTPSMADEVATRAFINQIPGFKAHIVINHDEYTKIQAFPDSSQLDIEKSHYSPQGDDKYHQKGEVHPLVGVKILDPDQLVDLAKHAEFNSKRYISLISTDVYGKVSGIMQVPKNYFRGFADKGYDSIRDFARTVGSMRIFMIGGGEYGKWEKNYDWSTVYRNAIKRGYLTDAVTGDGKSLSERVAYIRDIRPDPGYLMGVKFSEAKPTVHEAVRKARDFILKAKDISKLVKKVIINKKGKQQTVYVKPSSGEYKKKPWELTKEEFIKNTPEGFNYSNLIKHEADRHTKPPLITVGDKFFKLTPIEREHVIIHERGHELSDKMLKDGSAFKLADSGAFGPKYKDGTINGINGQFTPGENVAEAYAMLISNYRWLKEKYPIVYKKIGEKAMSYGLDIPFAVQKELGIIKVDKNQSKKKKKVKILPQKVRENIVEKAEFKKWFGNSKVVDDKGKPLVVYHGTTAEGFTEFAAGSDVSGESDEYYRTGSGGDPTTFLGSHFADSSLVAGKFARGLYGEREFSDKGGRIMPVYLKMENPLRVDESEMFDMMYRESYNAPIIESILEGEAYDEDVEPEEIYERYDTDEKYRKDINKRALEEENRAEEPIFELAQEMADTLRSKLIDDGHDGIIYDNEVEGGVSYVVFESTQVKSATGNRGTFDPKNPDITKAFREILKAPKDVAKLVKKVIINKRGKKQTVYVKPVGAKSEPKTRPVKTEFKKKSKKGKAIHSPAFKAWFGDWEKGEGSRVVKKDGSPQETHHLESYPDEKGEPIKVYHGTEKGGFTEFDENAIDPDALYGAGFYFTEDEKIAEEYAGGGLYDGEYTVVKSDGMNHVLSFEDEDDLDDYTSQMPDDEYNAAKQYEKDGKYFLEYSAGPESEVYEVYLNIRKPFDIDNGIIPFEKLRDFVEKTGLLKQEKKKSAMGQLDDPDKQVDYKYEHASWLLGGDVDIVNALLKSIGHDGLTHMGGRRVGTRDHRVWIAFKPNQIKATTAEEFDPGSNNIYKAVEQLRSLLEIDLSGLGERYSHDFKRLGTEFGDVLRKGISYADLRKRVKATETSPTEAQKRAGNYKKAKIPWNGLTISIENPKGSYRSGVDRSGQEWKSKLHHDYGYINRTEGGDGDHVDVFIGKDVDSDKVFVINQVDPETGRFDEHKVMIGFMSEDDARSGYLANYEDGWNGIRDIVTLSLDQFKKWLNFGNTKESLIREAIAKLNTVIKAAKDKSHLTPTKVTRKDGVITTVYKNLNKKVEIANFVRDAIKNPHGYPHTFEYGEVDKKENERYKKIGFDLEGYIHVLDRSGIRHIHKRHGVGNETDQKLSPVKTKHIRMIPDIVKNPDRVEYAGTDDTMGHDVLRYIRRINGDVVYVEEIRIGKKRVLATKSMRIEKRRRSDVK